MRRRTPIWWRISCSLPTLTTRPLTIKRLTITPFPSINQLTVCLYFSNDYLFSIILLVHYYLSISANFKWHIFIGIQSQNNCQPLSLSAFTFWFDNLQWLPAGQTKLKVLVRKIINFKVMLHLKNYIFY